MNQDILEQLAKDISKLSEDFKKLADEFDRQNIKTDAKLPDSFAQEDGRAFIHFSKNYMNTEGNEGDYDYAINREFEKKFGGDILEAKVAGGWKFGKRSLRELGGVHPDLVMFAHELLKRSPVDFGVLDGVRTMREQEKLVARGVSKTYHSYHIWGLALDIVPYVNGKYTWDDISAFERIHDKAREIIDEHGWQIDNGFDLWGWDRPHWQMTGMKTVYDIRQGGFLV